MMQTSSPGVQTAARRSADPGLVVRLPGSDGGWRRDAGVTEGCSSKLWTGGQALEPSPAASHAPAPANTCAAPATFELPHGISVGAIAEVAALAGDPARLNMLLALLDGFPLTASELADVAGVTPQTASSHIGKLRIAGLLRVEKLGRKHLHSLASGSTPSMLALLARVAVEGASRSSTSEAKCPDAGIGLARVCNGHLAGRLGVALAVRLADRNGGLTPFGRERLTSWGVDPSTLRYAAGCFDWSEQSEHLAGEIGALILRRSLQLNWIRRLPGRRTLLVTGIGMRGFRAQFGIHPPRVGDLPAPLRDGAGEARRGPSLEWDQH